MRDIREKKCGCVIYEVGPPVLCESHQRKADKKEAREIKREESSLRKTILQQAGDLGHNLSRFKKYSSCPGKYTAHCHRCGGIVIVYDKIPEYGDQVAGAVFNECAPSGIVSVLGEADREAIATRLAAVRQPDNDEDSE